MLPFACPPVGVLGKVVQRALLLDIPDAVDPPTTASLASLGAIAGDVAIVFYGLSDTVSSAGGPWSAPVTDTYMRWRTLTSADLPSGVTVGRGATLIIYRGVKSVTLRTSGQTTLNPPRTLAGFPPAQASAGLFFTMLSMSETSSLAVTTPPPIQSLASRQIGTPSRSIAAFDRLYPIAPAYAGEDFSYTRGSGSLGSGISYRLNVFELLAA